MKLQHWSSQSSHQRPTDEEQRSPRPWLRGHCRIRRRVTTTHGSARHCAGKDFGTPRLSESTHRLSSRGLWSCGTIADNGMSSCGPYSVATLFICKPMPAGISLAQATRVMMQHLPHQSDFLPSPCCARLFQFPWTDLGTWMTVMLCRFTRHAPN